MAAPERCPSQPRRPLRLVIADGEPRARLALRALLAAAAASPGRPIGLQVVGEAGSGQEAIQQTAALRPDIVVLDCRMPVVDGIAAAAAAIKAECPATRVVVLALYPSQRTAALAAGADACLLKGCPAHDLLAALLGQPPDQTSPPHPR